MAFGDPVATQLTQTPQRFSRADDDKRGAKMPKSRFAMASAIALAMALSANVVCAELFLDGSIFGSAKRQATPGGVLDEFALSTLGGDFPPLSGSANATWDAGFNQFGSGSVSPALLDYGQFRTTVASNAEVQEAGYFMNILANTKGTVTDTFVVTPANPGLIGTIGSITFGVQMTGSLTAWGTLPDGSPNPLDTAFASWSLDVGVVSNCVGDSAHFGGTLASASGYSGDPMGSHTVTACIEFGWENNLSLEFSAGTNANADSQALIATGATPVQAGASVDASHTMGWLGITQILDANGNPVQYTLTSASGTDWTTAQVQVVPEPSSWALLAGGLLLLMSRLRRRELAP